MAQVHLDRHEVEEGLLPSLCIRCGAPAALTKDKTFSWHPSSIDTLIAVGLIFNVLLLVGIILAVVMTKRMRVRVPLCASHQNHWLWRALFIWGGLGAVAVLGIGALAFVLNAGKMDEDLQVLAGCLCGGAALLGLIWLIAAAIVQNGAIRASEITDDRIALIRVSRTFVDALERERDEDEERFEHFSPRRRGPRPGDAERYYDPKAPRRQPPAPPPDAYEARDD
jgi:hypothetical protein